MKLWVTGLLGLLISTSVWAAQQPVDGLWESRYDASNTPSSHIRITTQPNGELIGVIETAYPRPGEHPSPNCTKCKGENKDKPIIGMKVLWGMMPKHDNEWESGHVLDVETGDVYSGNLKLIDNGNTLDLRGYVLSPMFGATKKWKRIK